MCYACRSAMAWRISPSSSICMLLPLTGQPVNEQENPTLMLYLSSHALPPKVSVKQRAAPHSHPTTCTRPSGAYASTEPMSSHIMRLRCVQPSSHLGGRACLRSHHGTSGT